MDADAARQVEPGLSPEAPLHSAVLLPHAVSGNCRLFAQMLRQGMQGAGVQFVFNAQVTRLSSQPTGIWVNGEPDMRRFDAVVVCAGAARTHCCPRGIRLPMAPVFGYSVSAPCAKPPMRR
jgi:D-amino-acid dehydrogenase